MQINEGGNVFKDAQGQPLTQRINKNDVPATVAWLEKVTGIDLPQNRWLGSTGRAPSSGDLDMAVDIDEINKEQLAAKLTQFIQSQGQDPREWVVKKGEVHLKTPIAGNPENGFVQTDFMFFPNLDWGTFFYAGGTDSAYKGVVRNVLMSSLAKAQGLKVGANGTFNRTSNELVTIDPDETAEWLLGPGHNRDSLTNVETIYQSLSKDPQRDAKLADFRGYLEREGLQEPGQVKESLYIEYNEVNFLARLRDRIVNQGMQPLVEADIQAKKDPRIPHPEDAFFTGGSAAAAQAIQGLESAAANAKNITIKWDGKPALVFGRMPNGKLAVMDKYMFDAGYAALSPEDWMKYDQQKKSGNLRTDLYPKLKAIWPGLNAATVGPGFYWGDLMWAGELQPQGNEYHFKPNFVEYSVPVNSQLGKIIPGKSGGIVVHQQFANLGDKKASPWNGKGLANVPGGVAIISPNIGVSFSLQKPAQLVTTAKQTVRKYGQAVDQLLNSLPASARQQIQTYFNQRIIGATTLSLPNWLKTKASGKTIQSLIGTAEQPGLLYVRDKAGNIAESPGFVGLKEIWSAIYNFKLSLAQQLEQQVQGLGQRSGSAAEGEGFVVPTPQGLVKLVNRGVFSAGNRALNNPT